MAAEQRVCLAFAGRSWIAAGPVHAAVITALWADLLLRAAALRIRGGGP